MTPISLESPSATGRLEELVDRLLAALLPPEPGIAAPAPSLAQTVHEARRHRQAGDLEGALAVLNRIDPAGAPDRQLRWLFDEWLGIARRRFSDSNAVLYSPATGRAAVLVRGGQDSGTLEAVAILGLRWPVGKRVARRSLRGLRSLRKGGP